MTNDARHLNLITSGTDAERSDTYGINMGPKIDDTQTLVTEYREIRSKVLAWRRFPTMRQREAMRPMRRRSAEIYKALTARGYDISNL